LAAVFVAELPAMLQRLKEGLRKRSPEEVREGPHALKGAVCNFSPAGPAETAARIEELARTGSLVEASALFDVLELEIAQLVAALRDFTRETRSCAS
jgi:HPt (histidine-containing phosphotransfer) domain-containing protein